jgi:hypothetical protein
MILLPLSITFGKFSRQTGTRPSDFRSHTEFQVTVRPNTVLAVLCQSALIRHKGSPSSSRFCSASNSTGLALVSLAKSAVATQGRSGPVWFAYSCVKLCKRLQKWNSRISLQDKMAQKNMAMRVLQGPKALATAWFDYFRQVLSSRPRCLCQLILSRA